MALLNIEFRPFFLLTGVHGALVVPLSLAYNLGYGRDFTWWPAGLWRMHEMVHGYAMAVIAGFLLTAVSGWQKTTLVSGAPLALLALVWFAGRLVMGLDAWLPPLLVLAVDLAFIPALIAIGIPGLFLAANGMLHFDIAGDMAVTLVAALLVCVLGWRFVPSFTRHTLDSPIVWSLHLGYGWLVAGLTLKGLGGFDLVDGAASVHGLTIAMVGTMSLAVMSRAALGHTGRPLVASPLTVTAYVLVSVAALARLTAAVATDTTVVALVVAAMAWSAALTTFVVVYAPILFTPRPEDRPG